MPAVVTSGAEGVAAATSPLAIDQGLIGHRADTWREGAERDVLIRSLVRLDRRNKISNSQKALANSPDAARAEKQFRRRVHIAELQMIAIGDHVDGNTNAARDDMLRSSAMNRLDEQPTKFPCVLQRKRD